MSKTHTGLISLYCNGGPRACGNALVELIEGKTPKDIPVQTIGVRGTLLHSGTISIAQLYKLRGQITQLIYLLEIQQAR